MILTTIAASFFLVSSATAQEGWPVGLDRHLSGHCDLSGVSTKSKDPLVARYTQAGSDEVCALLGLKRLLSEDPAPICPGVTPSTYSTCFKAVIGQLERKRGITSTGLVLMESTSVMYSMRVKKVLKDEETAVEILENSLITVLEALEHRKRLVDLAGLDSGLNGSDRMKINLMARIDDWVTKMIANQSIKKLREIQGRFPASASSILLTDPLDRIMKTWHYPDPTLKSDEARLRAELRQHPELPNFDEP